MVCSRRVHGEGSVDGRSGTQRPPEKDTEFALRLGVEIDLNRLYVSRSPNIDSVDGEARRIFRARHPDCKDSLR